MSKAKANGDKNTPFNFRPWPNVRLAVNGMVHVNGTNQSDMLNRLILLGLGVYKLDQEEVIRLTKEKVAEIQAVIDQVKESESVNSILSHQAIAEEAVAKAEERTKDGQTASAIPLPIVQAAKPKRASRQARD